MSRNFVKKVRRGKLGCAGLCCVFCFAVACFDLVSLACECSAAGDAALHQTQVAFPTPALPSGGLQREEETGKPVGIRAGLQRNRRNSFAADLPCLFA